MAQQNIELLIGETTAYDKKLMLERKNPRSWLKSVSAFANGNGGALVFGVADNDEIVGLSDAKKDSEDISEAVKVFMDPVPSVDLKIELVDGKQLIVLNVCPGTETPYYFVGNGQRQTYVRIGNESVVADRIQLKQLVMRGAGETYDSLPSKFQFSDMAFTKLRSVHFNRLHRSFEEQEFVSWGVVDENGRLTNAGALVADEAPIRHSRVFCTRWNGIDKTTGLGEALDDVELCGSIISQLQEAIAFVRANSHKRWWKEADHREELPDYPERAVSEILVNAIIHRDYMELGSEVHVDMFDDRLEIFSPGGMVDGSVIQHQDLRNVSSRRRNPLLADFFSRLDLMERRGSGMRKILDAYARYEQLPSYRAPEFCSNAHDFRVVLWNLNYNLQFVINDETVPNRQEEFTINGENSGKEFVKGQKEFLKERKEFLKERKEFLKAKRTIYRLVVKNPHISTACMAAEMGISDRQIRKHLKRLADMKFIVREGGRKFGTWRIIDDDYINVLESI